MAKLTVVEKINIQIQLKKHTDHYKGGSKRNPSSQWTFCKWWMLACEVVNLKIKTAQLMKKRSSANSEGPSQDKSSSQEEPAAKSKPDTGLAMSTSHDPPAVRALPEQTSDACENQKEEMSIAGKHPDKKKEDHLASPAKSPEDVLNKSTDGCSDETSVMESVPNKPSSRTEGPVAVEVSGQITMKSSNTDSAIAGSTKLVDVTETSNKKPADECQSTAEIIDLTEVDEPGAKKSCIETKAEDERYSVKAEVPTESVAKETTESVAKETTESVAKEADVNKPVAAQPPSDDNNAADSMEASIVSTDLTVKRISVDADNAAAANQPTAAATITDDKEALLHNESLESLVTNSTGVREDTKSAFTQVPENKTVSVDIFESQPSPSQPSQDGTVVNTTPAEEAKDMTTMQCVIEPDSSKNGQSDESIPISKVTESKESVDDHNKPEDVKPKEPIPEELVGNESNLVDEPKSDVNKSRAEDKPSQSESKEDIPNKKDGSVNIPKGLIPRNLLLRKLSSSRPSSPCSISSQGSSSRPSSPQTVNSDQAKSKVSSVKSEPLNTSSESLKIPPVPPVPSVQIESSSESAHMKQSSSGTEGNSFEQLLMGSLPGALGKSAHKLLMDLGKKHSDSEESVSSSKSKKKSKKGKHSGSESPRSHKSKKKSKKHKHKSKKSSKDKKKKSKKSKRSSKEKEKSKKEDSKKSKHKHSKSVEESLKLYAASLGEKMKSPKRKSSPSESDGSSSSSSDSDAEPVAKKLKVQSPSSVAKTGSQSEPSARKSKLENTLSTAEGDSTSEPAAKKCRVQNTQSIAEGILSGLGVAQSDDDSQSGDSQVAESGSKLQTGLTFFSICHI